MSTIKFNLVLAFTIIFFSCNNPLSKVYTEEGFMLDMVEVREANGEETAKRIAAYVMQQGMREAFDKDAESMLVGKTYEQLLVQADELEAEMKAKEEEEKRLAEEERQRKEGLKLKIAESITFAITDKGYSEGQYGYPKKITYSFSFKNKTQKDIAGVKGTVVFYDMFDERITSLRLSYDEGVKAGKVSVYKAQTDYSDFDSNEKKLKDTKLEKLKVVWEPEQLIFSDGEKIAIE